MEAFFRSVRPHVWMLFLSISIVIINWIKRFWQQQKGARANNELAQSEMPENTFQPCHGVRDENENSRKCFTVFKGKLELLFVFFVFLPPRCSLLFPTEQRLDEKRENSENSSHFHAVVNDFCSLMTSWRFGWFHERLPRTYLMILYSNGESLSWFI